MSMAVVAAMATRIKVRKPAEWRLLERSQPIIAPMTTARAMRNTTEEKFNCADQFPRNAAMASCSNMIKTS